MSESATHRDDRPNYSWIGLLGLAGLAGLLRKRNESVTPSLGKCGTPNRLSHISGSRGPLSGVGKGDGIRDDCPMPRLRIHIDRRNR